MKVLGLSFYVSALFSVIGSVLIYLMVDSKPEADPKDATIIRLTRGSWQRKP